MCASHWVFEAQRRSESKGCVSQLRGDPFLGAAPALRFDLVSLILLGALSTNFLSST
jgi:hypothetical protein